MVLQFDFIATAGSNIFVTVDVPSDEFGSSFDFDVTLFNGVTGPGSTDQPFLLSSVRVPEPQTTPLQPVKRRGMMAA